MARIKVKQAATPKQQKNHRIDRPEVPDRRPPHVDFDRNIELVVKCNVTGKVLARTGVMVTPIEANDIAADDHFDFYFGFCFEPAEGVSPPKGWEWRERYWCSPGSDHREQDADTDKTLYRVMRRADSREEWTQSGPPERWQGAVEYAEMIRRKLKGEVTVEPVEPSKVQPAKKTKGGT